MLGKPTLRNTNFAPFYSTLMSESAFLKNWKVLGNRFECFFNVTNNLVHNVSPLKGARKSGSSSRQGGSQRKNNFHYRVMFMPAIIKGIFPSEDKEKSTPEQNLVNHIKRSILLMEV